MQSLEVPQPQVERPLNTQLMIVNQDSLVPVQIADGEAERRYLGAVWPVEAVQEVAGPEWLESEQQKTRQFVADQFGFSADLIPDVRYAIHLKHGQKMVLGRYLFVDHEAAVLALKGSEERDSAHARLIIRSMVHEQGHAAYDPELLSTFLIQKPIAPELRHGPQDFTDDGYIGVATAQSLGAAKVAVKKQTYLDGAVAHTLSSVGAFFDEGLVEEIAIRYMEENFTPQQSPYPEWKNNMIGRILGYYDDGEKLVVDAAIATLGLNYLEEMRKADDPNGQSIFDILIAARHVDTQVFAMRQLPRIINGIEPGLYDRLQHAKYLSNEFADVLVDIQTLYARKFYDTPGFVTPPPVQIFASKSQ